jgi:hypothetical protein
MNYDNYAAKEVAYRTALGAVDPRPKTMRENIDRQLAACEAQMGRLKELKAKLESGCSLLDIDMNDLRQGMNY